MTNRDTRSLSYVGVGFVAIAAAEALSVMWLYGGRFHGMMMGFARSLPLPTQLAIRSREELTVVVLSAVLLAIGVHRHRRALLFIFCPMSRSVVW